MNFLHLFLIQPSLPSMINPWDVFSRRKKSNFILILLACLAILVSTCTKPLAKEAWNEAAHGVWTLSFGEPQPITLLDAAGIEPNFERINEFPETAFPLDKDQIHLTRQGDQLYFRFPLEPDEEIYGLGLQFKSVNRRGKIYNLHVDHYGGSDNGRTHAPVPFYVSSKGYGLLINSANYITVYAGTGVRTDSPNQPTVRDRNKDPEWSAQPTSDAVEILIPAKGAELILFSGASMLEVVSKYNLYNGGGCLPPKWGLGFTYRTHTLYSAEDVLNEVEEFEKNGFPLDFIGLEPGWQSRSYPCTYEWDEGRFPNPADFVQAMLEKKVRTNLWINPYISPEAGLYQSLLPLAGSHSVWTGIVPDYSLPEARKIFTDFYEKEHLQIGVSGLKIDECDGYDHWLWPDVATFPSGLSAEQMRQTYALFLQRMITEVYHENNVRTFGLVRGSNAGASSFPFVIYNDYYRHEDFITALINSGFSGVLWTPEARQSATGEEWLRRIQSVCFSPMAMINAWSSGTKPWSFPEVYEPVREVAMLRMRLLPYIYSTFADYHFNGVPPIRPMPLIEEFSKQQEVSRGELDDTKNPYQLAIRKDLKDQYLFGENLLVAPVFTGQKSRTVVLPSGKWFDFYTGVLAGEEEVIEINAELDKIPLFVRDGGIIPLIPARLHAPEPGEKLPLEIRCYGTAPGTFLLYDDDGVSFDYEKGAYSWTKLEASKDDHGQMNGASQTIEGNGFGYADMQWKWMTK